jgi:hypothetical protein
MVRCVRWRQDGEVSAKDELSGKQEAANEVWRGALSSCRVALSPLVLSPSGFSLLQRSLRMHRYASLSYGASAFIEPY